MPALVDLVAVHARVGVQADGAGHRELLLVLDPLLLHLEVKGLLINFVTSKEMLWILFPHGEAELAFCWRSHYQF